MTLSRSNPRAKQRWGALAFALATLTLAFAASTLVVHDAGAFELDIPSANAQDGVGSSTAGDDWDLICKANPTTCSLVGTAPAGTTTATTSSHVKDVTAAGVESLQATIFTGGGSKDGQDISSWLWKDNAGGLPDKDNLLHAYAARYTKPASASCPSTTSTCELIYFGSDRYANDGDATQAFWFLQNKVTLNGAAGGGGTRFTGTHKNGDLLIISEFSNGGTKSTITVYTWQNGALQLEGGGEDQACGLQAADPFCGIVNTNLAPTTAPWTFLDKAGSSNFRQGELYESGINLSDPSIALAEECFSSFVAETRSSTSVTATLKDFVLGQFESCEATLTTDASTNLFEIGGSVSDSATVHVVGGANPPAPTGSVTFRVCGPTAGITSCTASGTLLSTVNLNTAVKDGNNYTVGSGSFTPTSAGSYCFFATWPGDTNYPTGATVTNFADECFTVTPKTPEISTQVSTTVAVPPGTAVSDTATIGNLATPSNGTQGSITFRAYGPNDATCETAVYTSVVNPITGIGSYNSFTDGDGGAFAPTAPGTYRWRAFYAPATGDVNNVAVSAPCNAANESFVVQQFQPSLTTMQTWTVKDQATITVSGGGNLAGTASFELHTSSNCSDAVPLYTQNVPVSGVSPQNPETTPFTITTSKPTLYWEVSYSSTNASHANIAATCIENSSLTIDND